MKYCAIAQCEVQCATHASRRFTMRSITSRTEGVLIVPQGTLSSKKTTFVYLTNVVFFVELLAGLEPAAC